MRILIFDQGALVFETLCMNLEVAFQAHLAMQRVAYPNAYVFVYSTGLLAKSGWWRMDLTPELEECVPAVYRALALIHT